MKHKTALLVIFSLMSFVGMSQTTEKMNETVSSNSLSSVDDVFIMAFPNPSKGLIQFNKQVKSIVVFDLDGRRLTYRRNNDQVNLSHLKKGSYIIEINQCKTMVVNINPQLN